MTLPGEELAPKRFFYSLDGIRAIASLLVVVFHTNSFFGGSGFQESYLAVDLFFALSGVVICHSYDHRLRSGLSPAHFVWIRAARIYPLYLLGCALTLIAVLGFQSESAAEHLPWHILLAALLLPNVGASALAFFPLNLPAWSLFLEFAVNLFYAGVARFLRSRTLLLIMGTAVLGLACCLWILRPYGLSIGWRRVPWRSFDIGLLGGVFRVAYSFFAGVFLYRRFGARAPIGVNGRYAKCVPWAIFATVAALLMASPSPAVRPFYDLAAITVVFPAIIYLAIWFQPRGWLARACKFGGGVSYAVYALHYPLSTLLQAVLLQTTHKPAAHYAPWVGLAFLLALLPLCAVIDQVYDAPMRRRLLALRPLRAVQGFPGRA
jgi:peptidoglycan/LPS O-acetylase OafA/YrhL